MKRFIYPALFFLLIASSSVYLEARILTVTIREPIHPITAEILIKSIEKAKLENAVLLIIKLDTPGGLDSSMRQMIEAIIGSPVPVVAYVSPSGARAASAGLFISVACDIFAMAPGTSTGSAHPVSIGTSGQGQDKTMEEKITHDAAAYIRTLAEKRGRNVQMAEDAVRKSLSYTEQEALKGKLIDLVAKTEQELVEALDGKEIKRFNGEVQILKLKNQPIVELPLTFRQKLLMTIANPNLAYILLMLGLLGLYFEFANPGAILPGVIGGISLLLALLSFQILPVNYVGLLLILLGTVFFVLEIKVTSYGALAVGGVISLFLGSIILIKSPIPELRPSLKFIIPIVLGISLIFVMLVYLVIKAHTRKSLTGKEGLVGEVGQALSSFSPAGKIFVHGSIWRAISDDTIEKGDKVQVVEVQDHLTLKVKKV
ncbi:MAG TPA: nodulation protein NfeD [Candidatus Saccharicenans sp.]|jgi:membrane-bound serine protease (ClpP class)|nr:nodulation protein NfeD [Candidatus Saccharicenans sp.]HRD02349.1 nodulation protein NfeD [Candidatus Saccharicenans sp.]